MKEGGTPCSPLASGFLSSKSSISHGFLSSSSSSSRRFFRVITQFLDSTRFQLLLCNSNVETKPTEGWEESKPTIALKTKFKLLLTSNWCSQNVGGGWGCRVLHPSVEEGWKPGQHNALRCTMRRTGSSVQEGRRDGKFLHEVNVVTGEDSITWGSRRHTCRNGRVKASSRNKMYFKYLNTVKYLLGAPEGLKKIFCLLSFSEF